MANPDVQITVVVTVFNKENEIEACLESLKTQRDRCFRAIVADDGSSDKSPEKIRSAAEGCEAIKVISLPHGGVSAARNAALSMTDTPYVIFLDGDDRLTDNAIEHLNSLIAEGPYDLAVFGFSHVMPDGSMYDCPAFDRTFRTRGEILSSFVEMWNTGLMYSSCNKLFSMDIIRRRSLSFLPLDFGEDVAFCREYMKECENIRFTAKSIYLYTYHKDGSLSTRYRDDLFERRLSEHKEMVAFFDEMGIPKDSYREFLSRRYIERVVGCIENENAPANTRSAGEKYRRVKRMVSDEYTQECARYAENSGKKMKVLINTIKKKKYLTVYILGVVMAFSRSRLPRMFARLKYTSRAE